MSIFQKMYVQSCLNSCSFSTTVLNTLSHYRLFKVPPQAEWGLWFGTCSRWHRSTLGTGIILYERLAVYLNRLQLPWRSTLETLQSQVSMAQADIFQCWVLIFVWLPTTCSHSLCLLYCSLLCCTGSVGSKAQGGQPGSGVYGTSVAPVVSQGSGSFSHGSAATTTAPYSTDTSTDYSQYNQAYTQVLQFMQTHL